MLECVYEKPAKVADAWKTLGQNTAEHKKNAMLRYEETLRTPTAGIPNSILGSALVMLSPSFNSSYPSWVLLLAKSGHYTQIRVNEY